VFIIRIIILFRVAILVIIQMQRVAAGAVFLWIVLFRCGVSSYSSQVQRRAVDTSIEHQASDRRAFLSVSSTALSWFTFVRPLWAVNINVTPVAHTFITASGSPKPLRENDATRFLTNAKVVYALEGKESNLILQVLKLTTKRKADQGPGVTPGSIHLVSQCKYMKDLAVTLKISVLSPKEVTAQSIAAIASNLPEGDTLFVGPLASGGTAYDGRLVAETATALGVDVGGARGGGVLSVLLDGPKEDIVLEEKGYPINTLLWYSSS